MAKSARKKIWDQRGSRAVNCVQTDRYLKFGVVGRSGPGLLPELDKVATPVVLEVMSDTDRDAPDRKLCRLTVTIEELRKVVSELESEIDARKTVH